MTESTDDAARRPDDRPEAAREFPDDPRVPKVEDAVPTESRELGGAAPAVGPGAD